MSLTVAITCIYVYESPINHSQCINIECRAKKANYAHSNSSSALKPHTQSHTISFKAECTKLEEVVQEKKKKNKATFSISSFLGNLRTWKSFQELASARGPHALFSACLLSISLLCSLFTLHQASRLSEKKKNIYKNEKGILQL